MTVKSLRKQLAAAIAMTLVATVALGSSTYAWFSLNSKVTATGMNVRTEVKNNLLISQGTDSARITLATTALPDETTFKTSMVDNINCILQPTSTIDGKAYFYTDKSNVMGSGDHINDEFFAYNASTGVEPAAPASATDASTALDDFRLNAGYEYGDNVYGFKDFVFVLKAQNTSGSTVPVKITGLNLVYGADAGANVEKAFRIAILSEKYNGTAFAATPGDLVTILTCDNTTASTQYFTDGKAVSATNADVTDIATGKLAAEAKIGDVNANTTDYFKVVVRLWLEGEDETCNNDTYAKFTDTWALDLKIELDPKEGATPTSGVVKFTASDTDSKIALNTTTNAAAGTPTVIDGVNYYLLTDTSYYTLDTTFGTTSRVFQLVEGHPIEITNQCTITTTP